MTNLKPNSKKTLVSFDDVIKTLKEYIEEETTFSVEEIKPSDRLSYDLNLDSLHRLEMIIRLEHVYGVEIDENVDLERAQTLADFATICQNQINQGQVVAETLKTTNEKIIPSPHTKNVNKIATNIQTQMTAVKPVENSLLQRIKSAFVKSK